MISKITYIVSILLLVISLNYNLHSQKLSEGEEKLVAETFSLFGEKDYENAMPKFSQLLSLYPKHPDYNYGYAVCLIETNTNTVKALDYLKFASARSDNPIIYFYMGRSLHLNYKFDEALKNYGSFKNKSTPASLKQYEVDKYIDMCKNGKDLLRYISDLIVLDNKKIKRDNFQYSYELNDYGGKLIIKTPEFISKADEKNNASKLMFISDLGYIYFSRYNKNSGLDIYRAQKNKEGEWGEQENLGNIINSQYDEDYPFIHADGRTLYFSSKGHNTMGGYDIFKSSYDTTTNAWSKPENLDFPTNSPYDDFLFISDANEDFAYFASSRETYKDKVTVYKIEIDKDPILKEYDDLFEILYKSKLEVTPLADLQNNQNSDLINTTNQNNGNTADKNKLSYNFNQLDYSNNLSINDILEESNKDVKVIEEDIKSTEKEANIAYILADEKNKQADEKQIEADKIRQTDPGKADIIDDKAKQLEKEAVLSYNLAKNLENSVTEKQGDVEDTKQFISNTKNSDTDVEQLVKDLNSNREYQNKCLGKYTTIDSELENKQELADKKANELKETKNNLLAAENDKLDIGNQVNELEKRLDNSKDETEISILKDDIAELENDKVKIKATENKEKHQLEKLKIEVADLNNEVEILKDIKNNLSENNESSGNIAEKANNINKEELEKNVFDSELTADHNLAKDINNIETDTSTENDNKDIADNTETDTSENTDIIDKSTEDSSSDIADNTDIIDKSTENDAVDITVNTETSTTDNNDLKEIYNQSQVNKNIADSLRYIAELRKNDLAKTDNEQEKEKIREEIIELEELAEIKDKQANDQLTTIKTDPKEKTFNFTSYQEDLIDNNPVYKFSKNDDVGSKTKQYEKEKFNAYYYENLSKAQEKKLTLMKAHIEKTEDNEIKKDLQKDIVQLEKLTAYSKKAADESNKLSEKLKKELGPEVDDSELTNEALLAKATEYEPKNNIEYSKVQEETIEFTALDRQFADKAYTKWNKQKKVLEDLSEKLNKTDDVKEQKKIKKDIDIATAKSNLEFLTFNQAYSDANKEGYDIYKDVLDKNRIINDDENSKLANKLEKDANAYYEKANLIRENADLIGDVDTKTDELIKAKNYELIALQHQKHAIDLYIDEKKIKDKNLVAENTETNTTSDNETKNVNPNNERSLILLTEEEDQLKQYRKENHIAETLKTKAEKDLADIQAKRDKAENTYSNKDKNKLLKGLDEKEQEARNNLEKSYIASGKSDSLKYNLYKNQLDELNASLPEVGNNKKIAKQYTSEADFYYTQARELHTQASNTENHDQRIELLEKAVGLEKQAMYNQDIAVDILMEVDPIEFASNSTLVEIDKLEAMNTTVNVENVPKIDIKDIIDKINLIEDDRKALDDTKKISATMQGLHNEADEIENRINELKQINEASGSEKVKNKNNKEIKKLEKRMFANRFGASELSELVNSTKYWIYKDNFLKNRIRGTSEEAKQGKQLEKNANVNFRKARSLRDKSFLTERADKAYSFLVEANELELKALADQEAAYGVYLGIGDKESELIVETDNTDIFEKDIVIKSNADISEIDTTELVADNTDNTDVIDKSTEDNTETDTADNTDNTDVIDKSTEDNTETDTADNTDNTDVIDKSTEDNTETDTADNTDNTDVIDKSTEDNTETDTADNTDNTDVIDKSTEDNTETDTADNTDNTDVIDKSTEDNTETDTADNTDNTDTSNETDNSNNTYNNTSTTASGSVLNFSIEPVSRYSASNPIPMNVALPEGIVFKVQIGAFKQAINQDAFKGLNPVTGEKLPNSEFTRYLVGLFGTAEGAMAVQKDARTMGYRDAFIVAYRDGKRISLYQARNLIKSGAYGNLADYTAMADKEVETINNRTGGSTASTSDNTSTSTTDKTSTTSAGTIKGTDVNKVEGLFYSVQIGVYKLPIPHSKLYYLSPIFEHKTEYGFTRYTTGVFNNYDRARSEMERIVELGITDAFVVIYYKGKRLTFAEAGVLEISTGVSIFAETQNIKMKEQDVVDNTPDLGNTTSVNISFKVQIGAYKEQVPNNVVSGFIKIAANNKLNQKKNASGVTIYSVGNFNNYDQAQQTKTFLMNEGIKDAFIIAFNGDKKIPLNEAIRLLQ